MSETLHTIKNGKALDFSYRCSVGKDALTRVNNEDYCLKCQCVVHDLTMASKQEIKTLLAHSSGSACGRFFLDQVESNSWKTENLKTRTIVTALVAALSISASGKAENSANINAPTVQTDQWENSFGKKYTVINKRPTPLTGSQGLNEPEIEKPHKPKKLFHVGLLYVYAQRSFPFLRIRRLRMGRMRW